METKSTLRRIRRMLAVGVISGLLLTGCASTSDQFEAFIKNADYVKAVDLYTSEMRGNSSLEIDAKDFLESYLDEQWSAYLAGEIDSSAMEVTLDVYTNLYNTIPVDALEQIVQEFGTTEEARSSYKEGVEAMESGDYAAAIESFEHIPETLDNTYEEAQPQLDQAKSSYSEEILVIANESLSAGDYDAAISVVEEAEKVIGETDELEKFLDATYTDKFETSIADALASADYEELFRLYDQATANAHVTVSSTMTANYATGTESYVDEVLDEAAAVKENEGLPAAMEVIRDGLTIANGQSRLTAELDALSAEYVQSVLTGAESAFQTEGYMAAINAVNNGLSILPDSEELTAALKEYESYTPIPITKLLCVSDGPYLFDIEGSLKDNYNNEYSSGYYLYAGESGSIIARYRLGGKYTKLSGKVAYEYPQNTGRWGTIRFYDDNDNLLFETNRMDIDSQPQEFSFSVEGVQNLTIRTNGSGWACNLIVPYLQVQK